MKQNSMAAMSVKQKTFVDVVLAIVLALFGGAALLVPTWKAPAKAETPTIASWYVDPATATMTNDGEGYIASLTLISDSVSFSFSSTFTADADHAYVAVKYSGEAALGSVTLWGTKGGTASSHDGWAAGDITNKGWTVPVKEIGSDFSVVVVNLGAMYTEGNWDIDTVTNIGFIVSGSAGDTFVVHAVELLADANHNFGTPTPPVVDPIERGDMEVCDMVNGSDNAYTIAKRENGAQTVTESKYWGTATTVVNVKFWDSTLKYLIVDVETDQPLSFGVGTASGWANLTSGYKDYAAGDREKLVFDMSTVTFDDVDANLYFFFDPSQQWGADMGYTRTVTFHEISFSETDPRASTETNAFRTPVGFAGVAYSESDKKVSYTNTNSDYYRYLEVLLDNHDTDYDVLSIDVTGYNGLVLGVRVLYNDEVEGEVTAATVDVIPSSAYYSKIETADRTEIVIYLEAYGLKGCEVTGVQLYLDAPADAGKDGDVEITLNNIEVLNSETLAPAATAITASDATITEGETPDFGVALKAGDTAVNGKILTEYRSFGATGAYAAGLPTAAGEYEVRFYYMGSREYSYSRTTTVKLTVNAAETPVTPPVETKTLSSITVTTQPTKKTYTVGDTLDLTGLVVTATYSDETTETVTVTTAMLSDYDMSKAGTYTVKVTYEGEYTTFEIKVNAKAPANENKDNNDNGDTGLTAGAIAGIVVGCIAAVAVIAAVVIIVLKKKKN